MSVKPKKHLGQHFLKDDEIAKFITDSLIIDKTFDEVLEIGPGMGVLTKFLLKSKDFETYVIDIDEESIDYLKKEFPALKERIIFADFLKMNFGNYFKSPFAIIGNFPYNISSQILFKVLENRNQVPQVVGMFQKEVAERIASKPGRKAYGILSVFMQAFYDIEYLITVSEEVFDPPPKVKSGVLRFVRNEVKELGCDEKFFFTVVKTAFNQRRKTIRNSLRSLLPSENLEQFPYLSQRPEELSWQQFVELTNSIRH